MKTETLKTGKLTRDDTENTDGKGPRDQGTTGPRTTDHGEMRLVEIGAIATDPEQPRKEFAPEKLEEMKDSILQHGVLQPLIVRAFADGKNGKDGTYVLVSGERRLRGAKLAGLKTVPVIVRELDEKEIFAVQMVENLQRENLTALEEAAALQRRVSAGARPDDLARELGISRATVFGRLTLTRLQTPVRKALIEGRVSTSVAQLVGMVPEPKKQEELLARVAGTEYSGPAPFREVQDMIEDEFCVALKGAPFDLKDATLLPVSLEKGEGRREKGGACGDCPHRTGNMPAFPDQNTRPNVCTKPECYHQKVRAHWVNEAKGAVAKGQTVLDATEYKRSKGKYVEGEYSDYHTGYISWKECMGKHAPPHVLAVTERGLIKVYPREEALAAARKNGKKVRPNQSKAGMTKEEREKETAKEKKLAAERVAREKLIIEQTPAMAAALEKLSDKQSWELLEEHWGNWNWTPLAKTMVKEAKSARGRVLADRLSQMQKPVNYDGQWGPGAKVWKGLGVDLVKLEKDGKAQNSEAGKAKTPMNAKDAKEAKGKAKGKK